MLLKRILIVLGIMCTTSLFCAGLLLLGNRNNENEVNNSNQIDVYNNENSIIDTQEVINTDNIVVDENKQEEKVEENTSSVENVDNQIQNNEIISNNVINNEIKQTQNIQKEETTISNSKGNNEVTKTEEVKEEIKEEVKIEENVVQEKPKEDVYTFKRNDAEIQNMINIAKRIIKKNKDNRCDGLVDKVDSINFIVGKVGNLFYPLFDYRIENIVIDNFYPEFYVYAEDIYKNGEYLRTEYYFN